MGSSLDRALLLAELLRAAGHSSRLARKRLSPEQANDVLARNRPTEGQAPPRSQGSAPLSPADRDAYAQHFGVDSAVFRQHTDSARQKFEGMRHELSRRIDLQVPVLLAKVGAPKVPDGDNENSVVEALRDYWWVQLLEGGQWLNLDPLSNGLSPAFLASDQTYTGAPNGSWLPEDGQFSHEVQVRFIVERRTRNATNEHTALAYRFRPADAANEALFLRVQPRDWTTGPFSAEDGNPSFRALVLKQKAWVPTLIVGNRQISQFAFTDQGDLEPVGPMRAGHLPARQALSSMADAFGGSETEPPGQLTAAWVTYDVTIPGRPTRSFRRQLFDVVEPSIRAMEQAWEATDMSEDKRLERAVGLIQELQIFIQVSRLTVDYSLLESAREWRQNQSALVALSQDLARQSSGVIPESLQRIRPMSNRLLDLGLVRFAWSPVEPNVFLGEPNILTYRTKYGYNDARQLVRWHGFDIVTGRVESLSGDGASSFRHRLPNRYSWVQAVF
jgi:hypothetical protein